MFNSEETFYLINQTNAQKEYVVQISGSSLRFGSSITKEIEMDWPI